MKYWAFISYSHKDKKLAKWLHQAIETYNIPKELIGKNIQDTVVPKKLYPIFLDQDELSSTHDLTEELKQKLYDSRNLIVICSPNSNKSKWVSKEIQYYISIGRKNNILCIIIDGKPYASLTGEEDIECIPLEIRQLDKEKPHSIILSPDIRNHADGKENAKIKIISNIIEVEYSVLNKRQQKRNRKRNLIIILLISAMLSSIYLVQYINALKIADEKTKSELRLADNLVARGENLFESNKVGDAKELYSKARSIYINNDIYPLPSNLAYQLANQELGDKLLSFTAHDSKITAIKILSKNNQMISGDINGNIKMFDLLTGDNVFSAKPTNTEILDINYNENSNDIVILSKKGEVKKINQLTNIVEDLIASDFFNIFINLPDESILRDLSTFTITSAKFSSNNNEVVFSFVDYTNDPEEPDGGTASKRQSILYKVNIKEQTADGIGLKGTIYNFVLHPNGKKAIVGTYDGAVILPIHESESFKNLEGYTSPVEHPLMYWFYSDIVAVSNDGNYAAFGTSDDVIDIWDIENIKKISSRKTFFGDLSSIVFTEKNHNKWEEYPDIYIGSKKGSIYSSLAHNSLQIKTNLNSVSALVYDDDKKYLIGGGDNGNISIWNLANELNVSNEIGTFAVWAGMDFYFNSPYLLVYDTIAGNEIQLWKRDASKKIKTIKINNKNEYGLLEVRLAKMANQAYVFNKKQGEIFLIDLETGKTLKTIVSSGKEIEGVAISADREFLIYSYKDGELIKINYDGKPVSKLNLGGKYLTNSLSTNSDGSTIVFASSYEFSIITKNEIHKIQSSKQILSITVSNDGRRIATTHPNGEIQIWDVGGEELVTTIDAHNSEIHGLRFSNDGYFLITGSEEGELSIWQATTGMRVFNINGIAPIFSLEVSHDGIIAVGVRGDPGYYGDADVIVWDTTIGENLQNIPPLLNKLENSNIKKKKLVYSNWYALRNNCKASLDILGNKNIDKNVHEENYPFIKNCMKGSLIK